jgi:hypothetical protein
MEPCGARTRTDGYALMVALPIGLLMTGLFGSAADSAYEIETPQRRTFPD